MSRSSGLVLARSLAAFTVLELLAVLVLLGLNAGVVDTGRLASDAILAVSIAGYAGAGLLIASRLPGNAVGWLLSLIGLTLAGSMLTEQYALYGLATAPGSAPAARLAGWVAGTLAPLSAVLLFSLVLLFPDGRPPSRRWRPVRWALVAVTAGWVVAGQLWTGTTIQGGITDALDSAPRTVYRNPLGIIPDNGLFGVLAAASYVLVVIAGVLSVASVFARRRGAGPELRRQLAWLGYVGLLTGFWALAMLVQGLATHGANDWLGTLLWSLMELSLVAGIPLACAVAVLKYRLYEIDRIISRTLAYAIVTGLLVGVYAGLVLLATRVLSVHTPVAVAAATLAATALFNPLRQRVQRSVDRRFNRARYDADQMVAAFAARLKDAVDLASVQADLTGVVQQALEPAHLSVWVSRRG